MQNFEHWARVEFTAGVSMVAVPNGFFTRDNKSAKLGIRCFYKNEPYIFTNAHSLSWFAKNSDGVTRSDSGTVTVGTNEAYAELPEAALVTGPITVALRLEDSPMKQVAAVFTGYVHETSTQNEEIPPWNPVPDIRQLMALIGQMEAVVDEAQEVTQEVSEHFQDTGRFVVGTDSTVSSNNSAAIGWGNTASGASAQALGSHTIANHAGQHVFGAYNEADPSENGAAYRGNYIEIVGNGLTDESRSNARTLDWNGNEVLAGTLTANGVNLNDSVANLNDGVTNLNNIVYSDYKFTTAPSWSSGGINTKTGSGSSTMTAIKTGYIEELGFSRITLEHESYRFYVCAYNKSDSTYIGVWDGTTWDTPSTIVTSPYFTLDFDCANIPADAKIRIAIYGTTDVADASYLRYLVPIPKEVVDLKAAMNGGIPINTADYTFDNDDRIHYIYGNDKVVVKSSTKYESIQISVNGYHSISITANNENPASFTFVTEKLDGSLANGADLSGYLATGEPGRRIIDVGNTEQFAVPDDAAYVVLTVRSNSTETTETHAPSSILLLPFINAKIYELDTEMDGVKSALAKPYNPEKTYFAGEYATNGTKLYRCLCDIITPEAWTSTNWLYVDAGEEFECLQKGEINYISPGSDGTIVGSYAPAITGVAFGHRLVLNGETTSNSTTIRFIMLGRKVKANSNDTSSIPKELQLQDGHTYLASMRYISGTLSTGSVFCRWYIAGSNTVCGTYTATGSANSYGLVTYDKTLYPKGIFPIISVSRTNGVTLIDYTVELTIRDVTLEQEVAPVEGTIAFSNHAIDDVFWVDGKLYKATAAIASGESIVPGTNVTKTTVMAELSALKALIANN